MDQFNLSKGFRRWMLGGRGRTKTGRTGRLRRETHHGKHAWWKVMCLTGVDYFSTLGYQPAIAFLAAGALSPLATLILVLLTLGGALPIYSYVAHESPRGEGSIAMLETLLARWKGKLFVLCLIGFAATDFIITITLSSADATAHIVENPFVPKFFHHRVALTLFLLLVLAAIFLKGFKEAIGIAVALVGVYLLMNVVVIGVGTYELVSHPVALTHWMESLQTMPWVRGDPIRMLALSLLIFPKLALGLSGFETGAIVMPLVKGDPDDQPSNPVGRIRNTRKLLTTAALIMSVLLLSSSLVTTTLIPAEEFRPATATHPAGAANGRALAFLAHEYLGEGFGTAYDLSTILILWFAGASAMAGLLNLVPRYLPRYGMAPSWARATRPLVLVYTTVAFAVTLIFNADVDQQAGAYATGVLVLISSAGIATAVSSWRRGVKGWYYLLIALIFCYTTVVNVILRPEGIKIAAFFIATIVIVSFASRAFRATELRIERVVLDDTARHFIDEIHGPIRIVANRCDRGDANEYGRKLDEKRHNNHIPPSDKVVFFEVQPRDASEFTGDLKVKGVDVDGYRVLRSESPAVPNAIAAFLLHLRDETGQIPHVYFGWGEGNPLIYLLRFLLLGEGDTAPVTHEVLRIAEPDPARRPYVHVGG